MNNALIFCGACGSMLHHGARFCAACGAPAGSLAPELHPVFSETLLPEGQSLADASAECGTSSAASESFIETGDSGTDSSPEAFASADTRKSPARDTEPEAPAVTADEGQVPESALSDMKPANPPLPVRPAYGTKTTQLVPVRNFSALSTSHHSPFMQQIIAQYAPAARPTRQSAAKKRFPLLKALAAVAAVLTVMIFIFALPESSAYSKAKNAVYAEESNGEVIVYTANNKRSKANGTLAGTYGNLDGTKSLIATNEGGDGYTLYYADNKLTRVNGDVYNWEHAALGGTVVYTKRNDDGTADLYRFRNGSSRKIAAGLDLIARLCVSPDGKTVGYAKRGENGEIWGYLWDGKERTLGQNKLPQYLSDGAKFIYYQDSGVMYVQKGMRDENAVSLGVAWAFACFNRDLSQVLYAGDDGRLYICNKGTVTALLPGESLLGLVCPAGTERAGQIYGVKNFAKKLYIDEGGAVYYIGKKYLGESVVKGVANVTLCDDGKTIIYERYGKVYKINAAKNGAVETTWIDEKVNAFTATGGGANVYYQRTDGALYCQKGINRAIHVSDKAENAQFAYLYNDKKLFYVNNGKLYVSKSGAGSLVSSLVGRVAALSSDGFSIHVRCEDGERTVLYRSRDGKKFEQTGSF